MLSADSILKRKCRYLAALVINHLKRPTGTEFKQLWLFRSQFFNNLDDHPLQVIVQDLDSVEIVYFLALVHHQVEIVASHRILS
jgi:hypothetical protein